MHFYSETDTGVITLLVFLIAVDDKMAANISSSQNKTSSAERDSLTPCSMQLSPCNMQKHCIVSLVQIE